MADTPPDSVIAQIFSWSGTTLSLFFFLSPIVLYLELSKTKNVEKIPGMMVIFTTLNTAFWLVYGFGGAGTPVWVCNGIGLIFNTTYVVWYLLYFFYENLTLKITSIGSSILVIGGFVAIGLVAYNDKEFADKVKDVFGYIALVMNIIMYASPGQNIVSSIFY